MSLNRKILNSIFVLTLFSLVAFCALSLVYFYLPTYLQNRLLPRLIRNTGITAFAQQVRHVGWDGAELTGLRLGPPSNPALVIRSVQLVYSPAGLYHKKIKRLVLSGVELYTEYKNGRLAPRGIDLKNILQRLSARPVKTVSPRRPLPAVACGKIALRDATLFCDVNGQSLRLPFDADIIADDARPAVFHATACVYGMGQKIAARGDIDLKNAQLALDVDARRLDLSCLAALFQQAAGLHLAGQADIKLRADMRLRPFKLSAAKALLALRQGNLVYRKFQLQNSDRASSHPLRIHISTQGDGRWAVSASAISVAAPLPLTLSGFSGHCRQTAEGVHIRGAFRLAPESAAASPQGSAAVRIVMSAAMQTRFTAQYISRHNWRLKLTGQAAGSPVGQKVRIQFGRLAVAAPVPTLDISVRAGGKGLEATYTVTATGVGVQSETAVVKLPEVSASGTAALAETAKSTLAAVMRLRALNAHIASDSVRGRIAELSVTTTFKKTGTGALTAVGRLRLAGAGLSGPGPLAAGGIRASLPFRWPAGPVKKKGRLSIAALRYRNHDLGAISAEVRQGASGLVFKGRQGPGFIGGLRLSFTGNLRLVPFAEAALAGDFQLARAAGAPDLDLGAFFPRGGGILVNGGFLLAGRVVAARNAVDGWVRVSLENGLLRWPKNKLALTGIRTSLFIPHLPQLRSTPRQPLSFATATAAGLTLAKGRIDFQIESPRSIFIEKSHFEWCGGSVETQGMRLAPGGQDYRLILYCDRLNLAQVLEQFGATAATGRGTVNGRIPLRYFNGRLSFQDAFLYSTPGQGGKIRIRGTEILTAGIPPDSPQYTQMALASEALKDYDYSWAKLALTTEGENLLLRLQLDGKPANVLPFVYRKDIGGFVRVEAGGKGSRFQGIRLDVNFRLPLDKLLRYKDIINMIQ